MDRIVRLLPGRQVAARSTAGRRCNIQAVVVVHMARCAGNVGMAIGEREAECIVIKFSIGPRGDRMASRTSTRGSWEASLDMVRNIATDRGRAVPIRLMTTHAVGGVK